jgi:hypothetical protein
MEWERGGAKKGILYDHVGTKPVIPTLLVCLAKGKQIGHI